MRHPHPLVVPGALALVAHPALRPQPAPELLGRWVGESACVGAHPACHAEHVVYPVLLGTGKRFFAEGTPARTFDLVSTKAMPTGIILNAYKVAGALKTG